MRRKRLLMIVPLVLLALVGLFAAVGSLAGRGGSTIATIAGRDAMPPTDDAAKALTVAESADGGVGGSEAGAQRASESGRDMTPASLPPGRALVRTGEIELVVAADRLRGTVDQVARMAADMGGYVLSSSTGGSTGWSAPEPPMEELPDGGVAPDTAVVPPPTGAAVTVRVPSSRFDQAMRRFGDLGTVTWQTTSTQDVTDQMVDLRARLSHERAVERRLVAFLGAADTIREMLAVQDRLDDVQLQIERLEAQLKAMDESTSYSTITVALEPKGEPAPVIAAGGTVWGNFIDSWKMVGRGAHLTVLAAAAALPFLSVMLAIAGAVWFGVTRLERRRRSHPTPAG